MGDSKNIKKDDEDKVINNKSEGMPLITERQEYNDQSKPLTE
ncbi:hypothetical protein Molly5_131 [Maribacter phage Molly_5]|uniref:Uncharacterized protein n=2 Tax=Mollyvirus TaxID=2948826 RepID=A0A8E4XXY1_9CAUD|nr:hypothetical protein M1M29_gp130 [Maribacter phage Molly_1]YP_010357377.1 hypothetical protein M1M30_gp128 [Maribacter phage Colly_1]QQO97623.1 hypothetical protein Molly2_130 [Maribacter phage Molly_2]QQO97823.1 hypothetical protein Molly3_130 [Maribacter phage Molly_3]QQO98024.1 hypothetical protein Molly4_131 [Maribacter phage Molly_4]QQO98224.1 hypothetical protein Molly5_131 [Maribacter phage Molly_5]QQO97227.1 hypothetical protein Colly1_128 [Maribacter phage Colly_1]